MKQKRKSFTELKNYEEIQEIIGYRFQDENYLKQALTHSSYANEKHQKKHSDNERLEFLGDAVLELISSDFLYEKHPDWTEGELTKCRASLVCEPTLAYVGRTIRLGDFLLLGKGEEQTGGRKRPSVLSDAFEALIGAIYLDGGFDAAETFIRKTVLKNSEQMHLFSDSKTILQELAQGGNLGRPYYEMVEESGPDHDKHYKVRAVIDGRVYGCGEGHTKKAAEQEAAYHSLLILKKNWERANEHVSKDDRNTRV